MKRLSAHLCLLVAGIFICSFVASADPPQISISARYILIPEPGSGGPMIWDGKQWVPQFPGKMSGELLLQIARNGKIIEAGCNVSGSKPRQGTILFLCGDGEAFYLVGGNEPWPFLSSEKELLLQTPTPLAQLPDENLKKYAWLLWKKKLDDKVGDLIGDYQYALKGRVDILRTIIQHHHPSINKLLLAASTDNDEAIRALAKQALHDRDTE